MNERETEREIERERERERYLNREGSIQNFTIEIGKSGKVDKWEE